LRLVPHFGYASVLKTPGVMGFNWLALAPFGT